MGKKTVAALIARHKAEGTGLPRFECACGNEIWAAADAQIVCGKCFGAFRLQPEDGNSAAPAGSKR